VPRPVGRVGLSPSRARCRWAGTLSTLTDRSTDCYCRRGPDIDTESRVIWLIRLEGDKMAEMWKAQELAG